MVLLTTIFVFALLDVAYLQEHEKSLKCDVAIRNPNWKFHMVLDELQPTADALRKLNLANRDSQVRFHTIVYTYITDLNVILSSLNTIVASGFDQPGYAELKKSIALLKEYTDKLEEITDEDPEIIKEKLASTLEHLKEAIIKIKQNTTIANSMINTQWEYALDLLIYAINKVKYQALYFKEPHKKICARITDSINELSAATKQFKSKDKRALIDLRHRMTLLQGITEKTTKKLQTWIELNCKDKKNIKIAKDVIEIMSVLYKRENVAILELPTVDQLKIELDSIFRIGASKVQNLSEVDLSESTGAEEFIRSTLLDAINIGVTFSDNYRKMPY